MSYYFNYFIPIMAFFFVYIMTIIAITYYLNYFYSELLFQLFVFNTIMTIISFWIYYDDCGCGYYDTMMTL